MDAPQKTRVLNRSRSASLHNRNAAKSKWLFP